MSKFAQAKVYKITNDIDDSIYVGSTTSTLSHRLTIHKRDSKIQGGLLYPKMRELGTKHFKIDLLEECPTDSRDELRKRETYWIDQLKPVLNLNKAFNPKVDGYYKTYYDDHKEVRKETSKRSRIKHTVAINERRRTAYAENKDAINERRRIANAAKRVAILERRAANIAKRAAQNNQV